MTQNFKVRFHNKVKEEVMKALSNRGLRVQTSVSDGFFEIVLLSIDEALDKVFKDLSEELKPIDKGTSG